MVNEKNSPITCPWSTLLSRCYFNSFKVEIMLYKVLILIYTWFCQQIGRVRDELTVLVDGQRLNENVAFSVAGLANFGHWTVA